MTNSEFSALSRRQLLRLGGIGIVSATLLAACGKQAGVIDDNAIASIGTVPPTTALAEAQISDVVLLRTAASVEFNVIETYSAALDARLFSGDYTAGAEAAKRFSDEHHTHADAINTLVVALGGKAHRCANTRINSLYVQPALALITADKNSDAALDTVTLAHTLENLAAQMYQGLVAALSEPKLRGAAIHIGQGEARHAVVLAQLLNSGLSAVGPTNDPKTGKANVASAPTAFGSLASLHPSFGVPNADGVKVTLTVETPSLNALVYDFVGC